MNANPKEAMHDFIKDMLRATGGSMCAYAAERIEELEAENAKLLAEVKQLKQEASVG